jgi:hypothetical protein
MQKKYSTEVTVDFQWSTLIHFLDIKLFGTLVYSNKTRTELDETILLLHNASAPMNNTSLHKKAPIPEFLLIKYFSSLITRSKTVPEKKEYQMYVGFQILNAVRDYNTYMKIPFIV